MLRASLQDEVTYNSKHKGDSLYSSGAVRPIFFNGSKLQCSIDRLRQSTEISWKIHNQSLILSMACTCMHFDSGYICKHLWASLTEIDSNNLAPQIEDGTSIKLRRNLSYKAPANALSLLSKGVDYQSAKKKTLIINDWENTIFYVSNYVNSQALSKKALPQRRPYFTLSREWLDDISDINELPLMWLYKRISNNKTLSTVSEQRVSSYKANNYTDPTDRELTSLLFSICKEEYNYYHQEALNNLNSAEQLTFIPLAAKSDRLFWAEDFYSDYSNLTPVNFLGEGFNCHLDITKQPDGLKLSYQLKNSETEILKSDILKINQSGLFFTSSGMGVISANDISWPLIAQELGRGLIPEEDCDALISKIFDGHAAPPTNIALAKDLDWTIEEKAEKPHGKIIIENVKAGSRSAIAAKIHFEYQGVSIPQLNKGHHFPNQESRSIITRNTRAEKKLTSSLKKYDLQLPAKKYQNEYNFALKKKEFAPTVRALIGDGWEVISYGKKVTAPKDFPLIVSSGVDWFELKSSPKNKNSLNLSLPQLLAASKEQKDGFITLGDDSLAMLPEKWLNKFTQLAELGKESGDSLLFKKEQGLLLDGYLSDEDNIEFDRDFTKFQKELSTIKLRKKASPSKKFNGELRDYQKTGLSWLEYLNKLNLGGVLADDMGLGKTIQVLAFLQKKITSHKSKKKTNLLVVPKSLLLNWSNECHKFTPNLTSIVYSGKNRELSDNELFSHKLIFITYHTLRSDFKRFKEQKFNYVILDEAQAIKNPSAKISKVVKSLNSDHRLALTGTPIENSILDLFSIMEFSNPGLISSNLKKSFSKGLDAANEPSHLIPLNKSLSPLILRRNKRDVLDDLPEKEVQTLICEFSDEEQQNYNELKNYYQDKLNKKFKSSGFGKSKIDILEALLRLRQAACHPGLINTSQKKMTSAKLEVLIPQIEKIIQQGHKCLIFSQFTKFLKIAENSLIQKNISYSYLDGKTSLQKRQTLVDDFQSSDDKSVFLISLKAGGVGLNLTKADYVFILDPWWNPAAEMQAIDRSHRIGQVNKVFAYKLITKNTVEEKILELQDKKKNLSEAIINTDASLLKKMTMEDLNYLLN